MTTDLGRRFEYVELSAEELAVLLRPAFHDHRVLSVEPLTHGAINTNLKLRIDGLDEPFVLRIYTREAAACRKEVDINNLVHERVPMPEVVYARADPQGNEHAYMIYRWVEGVMLDEVLSGGERSAIASSMEAVGAVLANMGPYAFPHSGFFGPGLSIEEPFGGAVESWRGYIEMCLEGTAGERLGPELTVQLRAFVAHNEHYLAATEGEHRLVHSDFNGSNILVRQQGGEWRVAAVLDWEWAFASSQLTDVGNMLRDRGPRPPEFEDAFIRGFTRSGGHLPPEWKRIARLIDLTSMCEFLNSHRSPARLNYAKSVVVATMREW